MPQNINSFQKIKSIDTGVLFMLLSSLFGALNGAIAKILSDSMDPVEVVFYRNLIGGLIVLYSLQKIKVSFNASKIHLLFFKRFIWWNSDGTFLLYYFNYSSWRSSCFK